MTIYNEVIKLKKTAFKIISLLLCFVLMFTSVICCFAAVSFPAGVTEQTAKESAEKTDLLIKNMLADTQGKTLSELVMPTILSDETLSSLLVSVYSIMGQQADSLETIGIDTSTKALANALSAYPSVKAELLKADEWEKVNLEKAKWGVQNKNDFATAISAMLSPFNDVLYMLLCGGTFNVRFFPLRGDYGYKNGVIPMLKALGCTEIVDDSVFLSEASENPNTMMYNIILSIFSMLEKILESPAVRLSQTMPNMAHFVKNGGLENSVDALLSPLTLGMGNLLDIFSGTTMLSVLLVIQDSEKYTMDFGENFTTILNDALSSSDFRIAELDLDKLASCGTLSGDTVIANIGEAYTVIFTWLIDTLKLNRDQMMETLSENGTDLGSMDSLIDSLFAKSTDEIFSFIVGLFTKTSGKDLEYQWQTPTFTPVAATYTANLGQDKFQRVLDGIDELLSEFIAESSNEKDVSSLLKKTIYSSNFVSQLATALYSQLSGEDMGQLMSLLGMSFSPSAIAGNLTGYQFSSARYTLYRSASWATIRPENLRWGFADGDKDGFEKAIVAVLRPFEDLLRMLLTSDTIEIYGAINLGGSNGYNTAIIPLLEAIGCPAESIMTYDEFKASAGGDGVLENLMKPLLALVDKVIEKPVYTLTEILPNILFFVSNGSAMQCIENLITPIFDLLDEFSIKPEDLGFSLDEIKNTDILASLEDGIVTQIEDIKLESFDLKVLASLGQAVSFQSKATYNGAPVTMTYIKADQTGVLAALIRYLVGIISNPENGSLLDGMMGGEGAGTFGDFSSGIGEQMAAMSEDELIEWLYQLFFRERPIKEEPTTDSSYSTAFKYVPKKESKAKVVAPVLVLILVAIAVILIIFRKRIKLKTENAQTYKTDKIDNVPVGERVI